MSKQNNQNNLLLAEQVAAALEAERQKREDEKEFWRKKNDEAKAKLEAERAARDAEKQAAQAERAKMHAAEIELKAKGRARVAWLAAGGPPEEFDASWNILRAEMLKNAVVQDKPEPIFKPTDF